MEINGLPLHILVIHAAVVLGPLAALLAIAYAAAPLTWRDRLRWVALATVLIATGAIWLAWYTGDDLLDSSRFDFLADNRELRDKIDKHADLGGDLRWVASGFAAVTLLATGLHRRTGVAHLLLSLLLVAAAVATLVYTVLTGEAGSQAVWGQ